MWAAMSPSAPEPASSFFKPPDEREVRIDDPVLEVDGPPVPDFADGAVVDQLLGQLHGRHAAVVVVDHGDRARLARGLQHLPRLGEVVGQRLLADDVLARGQRGQHDLLVRIARRRDVDELDVGPRDQRVVVGLVPLPPQLLGRLLDARLVSPADRHHARLGIDVKEVRHLPVRIGMRPPHELVANQANTDFDIM